MPDRSQYAFLWLERRFVIEGSAPQAKVFLWVLSAKLAVLQLHGEADQDRTCPTIGFFDLPL